MANPKQLNRNELFKFLPDLRAVKAWEQMFDLVPEIEETSGEVSGAKSESNQTLNLLQQYADENRYAKSEKALFGKVHVEKDTVLFLKDAFSLDENTEIIFGENAEVLML